MAPTAPNVYQSVFAPGLFAGQVVVVTGGGSGIGRCTAHELARLGAQVVLVGRKPEKLQAVADEIAADGGAASWHACDIRSEDAVVVLVQQVLAAHGRVDGLVNNAGGQFMSPLESISAKGWEAVLHTNLTGGFLVARECYRQWMAPNGGSIVNIVADMWGSMPGMGHSGAARAGMVSFTETAALEWACSGVRVNAVAPGYIASSGMDNYPPAAAHTLRAMPQTVPLGRFGNEAEVSAAIVFLLSPAASFISGSTLRVDGARPQVRLGWPLRVPDAPTQQRAAVKPYGGFHRAQVPRVFAASAEQASSASKDSE
ncbi:MULTISPECIES: SDR family oxidoreductase [unclassified Acidovorax]|uniref:SDR family oxidoreductase n=1 Tax=unclassified Acidovorax TaxID=2684926 RepID=UPI001C48FC2A|nr:MULTISPECIES: SDR family oxidoreductase [unclassified Acidovorax]MBV7428742.1 SDR family oxidoreductase [Acidovorax sp. sif0732]MBV7450568.1 SDR family oxidoreductase [Acidovorax sp. sif0715]